MSTPADVRVLVVDHQPSLLRAVTRMLYDVPGITVAAAISMPSGAIERAEQIVCDVILYGFPVTSVHTFDSLKILRAKLPSAYIIASSVGGPEDRSREALLAGADEHLPAERLSEELVGRVMRHQRKDAE